MFLHHVLRHYLESGQIREAVQLATNYQHLVFFAHGLEILLHTVVESEATAEADESGTSNAASKTLPAVIEFLDHFDVALDVVVGCARKTEVTRWRRLFEIVGNPKSLFEVRLAYCPIYILIKRYLWFSYASIPVGSRQRGLICLCCTISSNERKITKMLFGSCRVQSMHKTGSSAAKFCVSCTRLMILGRRSDMR